MTQSNSNSVKVDGYTAKKIHWQNKSIHGSLSSCNVKLSYSGMDNKMFFDTLKNYPESACQKCVNKFKEHVKRKIESKK